MDMNPSNRTIFNQLDVMDASANNDIEMGVDDFFDLMEEMIENNFLKQEPNGYYPLSCHEPNQAVL